VGGWGYNRIVGGRKENTSKAGEMKGGEKGLKKTARMRTGSANNTY